jgi:hypothetical protein
VTILREEIDSSTLEKSSEIFSSRAWMFQRLSAEAPLVAEKSGNIPAATPPSIHLEQLAQESILSSWHHGASRRYMGSHSPEGNEVSSSREEFISALLPRRVIQ